MIRDIIENPGKPAELLVQWCGNCRQGDTDGAYNAGIYDLQRYFKDMVDAGCEYMVMEVSSQGIKMDRVAGMHFNMVFLPILRRTTSDQMSMQILMSICTARAVCLRCDVGIVNRDDPHWKEMIKDATCEVKKTYGTEDADMTATKLSM